VTTKAPSAATLTVTLTPKGSLDVTPLPSNTPQLLTSTPALVKTQRLEHVGSYNVPGGAIGTPYVMGSYAYVGHGSGIVIVEISNPTQPKQVGSYVTLGPAALIAILQHYAYVAENRDGLWLHIVDVSSPTSPRAIGAMHIPGRYDALEVYIWNSRTYAIVTAWHSSLRIFDISDIGNPQEMGAYPISGDVFGIDVLVPYAYVANWAAGVKIFDVSNPAKLIEVGRCEMPGWASKVYVAGHYAYVSCSDCEDGSLQIFDVSEPTRPKKVGYYPGPPRGTHIYVSPPYAYLADWDKGLRVIDVSNPSQPRLVGYYDSPGGEAAAGQKGQSNIYGVYAIGSYVYLSTDSGLLILQVPQ